MTRNQYDQDAVSFRCSEVSAGISSDLPPKEALYLFLGFSSYMRAPMQGGSGLDGSVAFKDAGRLLDHSRCLAQQPLANVSVLHVKYRFQDDPTSTPSSQVPIPQPFSVLHDPVIKIDYKDSGIFSPMPAQAISRHISQYCHPLPRVIVLSYVASDVTETHVAGLASWAVSQQPPIYVFSPNETRIRECRPLSVALGSAIPLSMYESPGLLPVASIATASPQQPSPRLNGLTTKRYSDELTSRRKPPEVAQTIRIPLWTLASGAGFLAGFTAKTWQIKISDFFASNLPERMAQDDASHPWQGLIVRTPQARSMGQVPSPSSQATVSTMAVGTSSTLRSPPLQPRHRVTSSHMTRGWKKESKERMEDALDSAGDEHLTEVIDDLIAQMENALRLVNGASDGFDGDGEELGSRASGMLFNTLR